jgi:hypothetical protein
VVLIHLVEGETLDLCHVIGVAPRWVALAVRASRSEPSVEAHRMRTVLVPYAHVVRVTMQPESLDASGLGFRQAVAPVPLDGDGSRVRAEAMFHAAGGVARTEARATEAS